LEARAPKEPGLASLWCLLSGPGMTEHCMFGNLAPGQSISLRRAQELGRTVFCLPSRHEPASASASEKATLYHKAAVP
jgi:hypothetical protein